MRKLFLVGILALGLAVQAEARTNYYGLGKYIGKMMAEHKQLYFPLYTSAKDKCEQWWTEGISVNDSIVLYATPNDRNEFMDGCTRAYNANK